MTVSGYSDRINHAFGFSAKHHDQQVRKGLRLPYLTQPANVAVILTRYERDEPTVVAGILHDTVEDAVREGWSGDLLEERIGRKFSPEVLAIILAVIERRTDDDGVELNADDRKGDVLARLDQASEAARWVCAADKLHNANTIVYDLARTAFPETVWGRFSAGREGTVRWYQSVCARFREIGFNEPIVAELELAAAALAAAEE